MGIILDKRKKMKLLAATALALAAADERQFADNANFISKQESFWYMNFWANGDKPAEYWANSNGAISYFVNAAGNTNYADKMQQNMQATLNLAKKLNQRCLKQVTESQNMQPV